MMNPRKQRPSPFQPTKRSTFSLMHFYQSFIVLLLFELWRAVVDPSFVHSHESMQKVIRIAIKHPQTNYWNVLSSSFLVNYRAVSFFIFNFSCGILCTCLVETPIVSANALGGLPLWYYEFILWFPSWRPQLGVRSTIHLRYMYMMKSSHGLHPTRLWSAWPSICSNKNVLWRHGTRFFSIVVANAKVADSDGF